MNDSPTLLPNQWTPIAERSRGVTGNQLLAWRELPSPLLRLAEAQMLAAKGVILMANKHLPDRVLLVVRPVIIG